MGELVFSHIEQPCSQVQALRLILEDRKVAACMGTTPWVHKTEEGFSSAFPTYFPPYGLVWEPRATLTCQQHSLRDLPQQGKQHSHPFPGLSLASLQLSQSDSLSVSYEQKWYKVKAENVLYEAIITDGRRCVFGFCFVWILFVCFFPFPETMREGASKEVWCWWQTKPSAPFKTYFIYAYMGRSYCDLSVH